jgi:LPXTG-motif cell wall-anchored protein
VPLEATPTAQTPTAVLGSTAYPAPITPTIEFDIPGKVDRSVSEINRDGNVVLAGSPGQLPNTGENGDNVPAAIIIVASIAFVCILVGLRIRRARKT